MNKYDQICFQSMNCFRHSYMPRAPQKASVVSFILGGLRGTSATRGTLGAIALNMNKILYPLLVILIMSGCATNYNEKLSCKSINSDVKMLSKKFYSLNSKINRKLWYEEIALPCETPFTSFWDDYHSNNYQADGKDFINYFRNDSSIIYAFQFGPNDDLWSFSSYIAHRKNDSVMITYSYFRHARFTYKGYAVCSYSASDSLISLLFDLMRYKPDSTWQDYHNTGYVIDRRTHSEFIIDTYQAYHYVPIDSLFQKKVINNDFVLFNNFINHSLKWNTVYKK